MGLQQACRDMTRLHALGFQDCSIAVNVSPVQIRKDDFIDTVEKALQASGLQPQDLELEVVESAVLMTLIRLSPHPRTAEHGCQYCH